jgi:lipopolysaccharide transport system ATP-binding protein
MRPIIRIENLSKQYRIGGQRAPYQTLRESLTEAARAPLRWLRRSPECEENTIWALKDVSFDVMPGEVLGVVGRNGAGKSTLLKVLSRVTEPTTGCVDLYGRVGSLLEVGTGFHPELTGRENVYLNGAILGMKRCHIDSQLGAILRFAEVERFADTPVKRYSSGMYLRLAFAVAAHLDPEILIVDEVLAVGDPAFQKKCLGKMGDVVSRGRTVILVSHNMMAIRQLCHRCLWLDGGRIRSTGRSTDVVAEYMTELNEAAIGSFDPRGVRGDGRVELLGYRVENQDGNPERLPRTNEDVVIHVRMRVREPILQPACGVSVFNEQGVLMTSINTVEQGVILPPLPAGDFEQRVVLKRVSFLPGAYTASFWVMNPQGHIYALGENAIRFELAQSPLYGNCQIDHRWGCVYTDVEFAAQAGVPTAV